MMADSYSCIMLAGTILQAVLQSTGMQCDLADHIVVLSIKNFKTLSLPQVVLNRNLKKLLILLLFSLLTALCFKEIFVKLDNESEIENSGMAKS